LAGLNGCPGARQSDHCVCAGDGFRYLECFLGQLDRDRGATAPEGEHCLDDEQFTATEEVRRCCWSRLGQRRGGLFELTELGQRESAVNKCGVAGALRRWLLQDLVRKADGFGQVAGQTRRSGRFGEELAGDKGNAGLAEARRLCLQEGHGRFGATAHQQQELDDARPVGSRPVAAVVKCCVARGEDCAGIG
jgi:hypothetical protein